MSPASALLQKPPPTGTSVVTDASAAGGDGDTRVYRGRSIDELIPRIEAELGADAIVIRRTRGLEGGIGGFFQRRFIEVEAKPGTPRFDMYDEGLGEPALPPAPQSAPAAPTVPAVPRPHGAYVTDTLATIAAAGSAEPVSEDPRSSLVSEYPRPSLVVEDPPPPPSTESPREFHELTPDTFGAALAEAEQALPAQMTAAPASSPVSFHTPDEPALAPTPAHVPDPLGEELDMLDRGMRDLQVARPATPTLPSPPRRERARGRIEQSLHDLGVSEELTAELIDAAIAHVLPFAPRTSLVKAVHGALVARIPSMALLPAHSATVAVIGPGGSGKTSCCAALLGAYRRAGSLPASCATIALVGEREEPAMLLSPRIIKPLTIASQQARQTLAQAREDGLLLLDMPPLSPAERQAIKQIAGLLDELKPDRVVVALPATLGAKAAAQLLEALRPLGASALAITHADETDQFGVAVEAACRFGLAPEYLLDRGRVRGGLTHIDPTQLADRLLP